MFINYKRTVEWSTALVNVGLNEDGLITCGQKNTTGAPATTAGKYIKGSLIQNMISGLLYVNTGTTAVPVWTVLDSGAIVPLNDEFIFVGDVTNTAEGVAMTGDVRINNTGETAVVAIGGNAIIYGDGGLVDSGGNVVANFIAVLEPQLLSGAGAIALNSYQTRFTSTGTGDALTLAGGSNLGHTKKISYVAEAGGADTGILTPTSTLGFTTITFNTVNDYAVLQWSGTGWRVIDYVGVTLA